MYDASEMVSSIHSLVKFRSQEAHVFRDVPRVFLDCATGVMLCVYTVRAKKLLFVRRGKRQERLGSGEQVRTSLFHHDSLMEISITRDCLDRQFTQVARRCVEHVTLTQTLAGLVESNTAKLKMGQKV